MNRDYFTGVFLIVLVMGIFILHTLIQIRDGRHNLEVNKGPRVYNSLKIIFSIPLLLMAIIILAILLKSILR
jgi:hypothetical protein